MSTHTQQLDDAIKVVSGLTEKDRRQLLDWLQQEQHEKEISAFSFVTSHSVLEKEWLNPEEDKAWESL